MAQSRLIELSYFDPHTSIRLTTYADTIVTDYSSPNRIISAVRFGGYPEVVKAMSDAIYGGATIDVCSNGETLHLDTVPKGYRRQLSHDGIYAAATLMANDDPQSPDQLKEDAAEDDSTEENKPRKCYIFCPAGDQDRLFEEVDRKTAAPLIPEFRDYVLQELIRRGELRRMEVFSVKEKMDAWVLSLLPEDKNVECVRIELKDLRELPRKYWYLGNNSFLLHGFFNYRYLVLGKLEEDKWFIGVPGIYQQQERVMAAIFGFPEFMTTDHINQFGYWYHTLDE